MTILILAVISVSTVISSCKNDKDEPSYGSQSLVGTWYFIYDGDIDYEDSFTFKSDGKFTYLYETDRISGRYSFDSKKESITFLVDGEEESCDLYFITNNLIDIEDFGTYIRK